MLEKELDDYFSTYYSDARKLVEKELKRLPKDKLYGTPKIWCAWELIYLNQKFVIVFGVDYPYSQPAVFLKDINMFEVAHVESGGKVCWLDDSEQYDPVYKKHFLDLSIQKVKQLIEKDNDWNEEAFQNEFLAYWIRANNYSLVKQVLLLDDLVGTYYGKVLCKDIGKNIQAIVANDIDKIDSFITDFNLKDTFVYKDCPVIEMKQTFLPNEFPDNTKELYSLIDLYSKDKDLSYRLLNKAFLKKNGEFPLIFNFGTRLHAVIWLNDSSVSLDIPGFRKKLKPTIFFKLISSLGVKIKVSDVNYADSQWLYKRGSSGVNKKIENKRVLILGCGSLGSGVISLLIQSGVKNIDVVDPDAFNTDNLMRHELPMEYVNYNKAQAIEKYMRERYPGILNIKGYPDSFEVYQSKNNDFFKSFDLIFDLTGNRTVMSFINALSLKHDFPPVLYGWLEAYSIVGHAIVVTGLGGCIECGFLEGGFKYAFTEWESDPQTYLKGCGVVFQSYGMTAMIPIQAMITRTAINVLEAKVTGSIHCTWIGDMTIINNISGKVTNQAVDYYSYEGKSNYEQIKDWRKNEQCSC